MRVALIRHPAPLIEPGICYGRLDVPLKAAAKVENLPTLAGMARVWTSPARRCLEPAQAIAAALGAALTVDLRLQELHFGAWEGKPWDDVPRPDLDAWAASPLSFAAPGGESGAALIARVCDFYAELSRAGEDCVVVSHGGPLKVLCALVDGRKVDLLAPAPAMGSVRVVDRPAGQLLGNR
jgi:alpha-ribazole phosphatase